MKRNIKNILIVLITLLLIAGSVWIMSRATRREDSNITYAGFFERADDIDVLFFGSSHVNESVYPMTLWHEYGITSYNMGNGNFGIEKAYWVFRNSLNYCTPKYAVFDMYGIRNSELAEPVEEVGILHDGFDCFGISKEKYEAARSLVASPEGQAEFLFPFIVYHNRWSEIAFKDVVDKDIQDPYYGAEYIYDIKKSAVQPRVGADEIIELGEDNARVKYVRRFISDCKERGIIPVLIYFPFEASAEEQMEANAVSLLAEEEGIHYFNMLQLDMEDPVVDGSDANSHLNVGGSVRATEALGEYLINECSAADHRGDDEYYEWDEDYRYLRDEILLPEILEESNLNILLERLDNVDFGAYIRVNENASLTVSEQRLIDKIPNLFGLEYGPLEEADLDTRVRVYVYDCVSGEELAILDY